MSAAGPSSPGGAWRPGAGKGKKPSLADELSAKILEELEGSESVTAAEKLQKRGHLKDIERHASEIFAPPYSRRSSSLADEMGGHASSPANRSEAGRAAAAEAAALAASLEDGSSSVGTFAGAGRTPSSRALQSSGRPSGQMQRSSGRSAGTIPRPMMQRHFGTSQRRGFFPPRLDSKLGPGQYDTHEIGTLVWERDHDVSHPGQKQLSQHKSPVLVSFGKPKSVGMTGGPPLKRSPGPGHYSLPDLWDASWQQFPRKGKSFDRKTVEPGESRFGGLARGLVKDSKGNMDFLG